VGWYSFYVVLTKQFFPVDWQKITYFYQCNLDCQRASPVTSDADCLDDSGKIDVFIEYIRPVSNIALLMCRTH
jgi:hypothetical protein